MAPSVSTVKTCVCPRVKSPEPCVLGNNPTSHEICLISSGFLPSTLIFSFKIFSRTIFFWISNIEFFISISDIISEVRASTAFFVISAISCSLSNFSTFLKACLSSSSVDCLTVSRTSSGMSLKTISIFGLPHISLSFI